MKKMVGWAAVPAVGSAQGAQCAPCEGLFRTGSHLGWGVKSIPYSGFDNRVGRRRISAGMKRFFSQGGEPRPDHSGRGSSLFSASKLVRTGRSSVWTLRLGT
jgi:hypothetical protein